MSAERDAIVETVHHYALGIDTLDWALYRSILAERLEIDFSAWNGEPARTMDADDWVARLAAFFPGLDASQHLMGNAVVDVEGDAARCRMYVVAEHFLEGRSFALGGFYLDRLIRAPGEGVRGWLLEAVTLRVLWTRGERAVMAEAGERAGAGRAARR